MIFNLLGRVLPPLTRVAHPSAIGAIEATGGLLGTGLVVNGGLTAISTTQAVYSATVRRVWDAVTLQAIKIWGTTRSRNSWEARRIEGPGIASEYSFQIDPNLAILAAGAQLESDFFTMFLEQAEAGLDVPPERYSEIVERPVGVTTEDKIHISAEGSSILGRLSLDRQDQLRKLREATDERRAFYADLLKIPGHNLVRFKREELVKTLQTIAAAAEAYLFPRFKDLSAATIADFWKSRELKNYDWAGLAAWVLAATFGPKALIPLEEADLNTSISISSPDISNAVEEIL